MPIMKLDVNVEEYKLVHNLASLVHITDGTLDCYYTVQAARVSHTDLYPTGVPGNKVSQQEPHTFTCPFLLNRTEGLDIVDSSLP